MVDRREPPQVRNIQIYSVGNRNYAQKVWVLKKKVGVKVYKENRIEKKKSGVKNI